MSYQTSAPTPDLVGFLNSRSTLYANFEITMTFLIPIKPQYSLAVDDVPLDAFGNPLDPWAQPASGAIEGEGFASAFASALLITRPFGGRGQVRDQQGEVPLGIIAEQELGFTITPADYARLGPEAPNGQTATMVEFWGTIFQIRQWRADGIGALQRYVVYITQDGGP
jgi:hypothetical protein